MASREALAVSLRIAENVALKEEVGVASRSSAHASTDSGRRTGAFPPTTNRPRPIHRLNTNDRNRPTNAPLGWKHGGE